MNGMRGSAVHLNSRTDLYHDEDPKTHYLTARLEGPLDEPNVQVLGQPFERRAPEREGKGDSPAQPLTAPEPEREKIKPEDIIKDLLRGLGN